MTFDIHGKLAIEVRDGSEFNLHTPSDCAEVVLTALDSALDRPPQGQLERGA